MRLALTIVVLIVGTATPAAAQPEAQGRQLYERAVHAFENEEFDRAAELFGELYTLNPEPLILYNRAYALGRAHNYTAAVESAELANLGELTAAHQVKNRARLAGYRARLAADAVANDVANRPEPVVETTKSAPLRRRDPKWAWFGGGAAAVAASSWIGTALLDVAIGRRSDDLEAARDAGDADAERAALSAIESRQRVARPLFVVGTLSTAAAATFGVIYLTTSTEVRAVVTPRSVSVRLAF